MILDAETAAFIRVSGLLEPMGLIQKRTIITFGDDNPTPQQTEIEKWIRGRVEFVRAGLEKCPVWFTRKLQRFDADLRLRWDFYKEHWVIERLNRLDGYFHACGIWDKPLGDPLIESLREGDLWKMTPGEIIKKVHDAAEKQQRANDHSITEEFGGAIDRMTNKQVQEFVDASEAMVTGEEIIPKGDDAKFMQRLYDKNLELKAKGLEVPDNSNQAMNPGMKPGRYVRQRREN